MGKSKPTLPKRVVILRSSQAEIERRVEECLKECGHDLGVEYVEALVVARQSLNDKFFDLIQAERER